MGKNASRAIDLVIEKKLNSVNASNDRTNELYSYARLIRSTKTEFQNYCFQFDDIVEKTTVMTKVDSYDNKFLDIYNHKVQKTQNRFNLLKLFKPGELLTCVSGLN